MENACLTADRFNPFSFDHSHLTINLFHFTFYNKV
jgi:hypothetical protein